MENLGKKINPENIGDCFKESKYTEIDKSGDAIIYFNQIAKALGVTTWGNIGSMKFIKTSNSKYDFDAGD